MVDFCLRRWRRGEAAVGGAVGAVGRGGTKGRLQRVFAGDTTPPPLEARCYSAGERGRGDGTGRNSVCDCVECIQTALRECITSHSSVLRAPVLPGSHCRAVADLPPCSSAAHGGFARVSRAGRVARQARSGRQPCVPAQSSPLPLIFMLGTRPSFFFSPAGASLASPPSMPSALSRSSCACEERKTRSNNHAQIPAQSQHRSRAGSRRAPSG